MSEQTLTQDSVSANGLEFHYLSQGAGPLLLCLHGFPDCPQTFGAQFEYFSGLGYRVVAPYMRGYHPATIPADGCYQTAALGHDASALIDALGYERAIVYGHDWGTAAAQAAALFAPEKVSRLITSAVPYGTAMFDAFISNAEQQRRSWYMFYFQLPFAEAAVSLNEYAFIRRLWQDWSPGWEFPESSLQAVISTLAEPGVLTAALGYYRALFNPAQQARYATDQDRIGEPITVPALHLHGALDGCIGSELLEGMEQFFSAGFTLDVLPAAGHFLHQEDPAHVNAAIAAFLES
jgi:pimeloyl-ACP methyl ester carboxylesterase